MSRLSKLDKRHLLDLIDAARDDFLKVVLPEVSLREWVMAQDIVTQISCPMPPSFNEAYTPAKRHIAKSKNYRRYARKFASEVTDRNPHLITLPDGTFHEDQIFGVYGEVFFDRIWKKRVNKGTSKFLRRLDLDNRLKIIIDCLSDFIGADDANLFQLASEKEEDSDDPRVEITIWRMPWINR